MSRGRTMSEESRRDVSEGQHRSLDAEGRGRHRSPEEGPKLAKFCKDALFRVQVELGLHELTATLSSLMVDALEASAAAEEENDGKDKMTKVLARNARRASQALPGITSARSRRSALHGYFRESEEWRDGGMHRIDPATRALLVEGLACLAGEIKAKSDSKSSTSGRGLSKRVDVSPSSRGWRRKVERNGDGYHQPTHQPALKHKHIFCNHQHSSNEARDHFSPHRLEIEDLDLAPASSQSVLPAPGISPKELPSKLFAREYFGEEKIVKGRRGKGALKSGMRHDTVVSKRPNKKSIQEEPSTSLPLPTTPPPAAREKDLLHTEKGISTQATAELGASGSSGVGMGEVSQATELCFAPKDTSTSIPGTLFEGSKSGSLEGSGSSTIEQSAAPNLDILKRLRLVDAAPFGAACKLQRVGFQYVQDYKEWPAGVLHDTCGIRVDRASGELWREMEGVRFLSPVPRPSRNSSASSSSDSFDSHHQSEVETCADTQLSPRRVVFRPSTGAGARESGKSIHGNQRTTGFVGMDSVEWVGLCRARDDGEDGGSANRALTRAEGKTLTAVGAAEAKERLSARGMNEETEKPPKVAMDTELVKAWRQSSRENGAPAVDALGFADLGASSFGWADTPCDVLGGTEDQAIVKPEAGKSIGPSSANLERDLRHATCLSRQPASHDPQQGSQPISARPLVYSAAALRTLELAGDECPSSPPRPGDHEGTTSLISHLMALPLKEPLRREFVKSLARHLDDYGHRDLAIIVSECGDASGGGIGHEAQPRHLDKSGSTRIDVGRG